MGTRHFIGVVAGGEFRVAQYGQWDGYPSGQGVDVLGFLRDTKITTFTDVVGRLRWITEPEINAVNADPKWTEHFPYLSRDAGAGVLDMVMDGKVHFLQDSSEFPVNSLFCEWAYVVDLDALTFEVYEGFNQSFVTEGRWAGMKDLSSDYYPVKLVKTYSLTDLPDNATFCNELDPVEVEEE